jgi:single stranded DNA-binding protein
MAINQFNVSGNLGADPVQETSKTSGTPYTSFSLAHTEGDNTTWYNCRVFGKSASAALERLKKGDHVFVSGKLTIKPYMSVPSGSARVSSTIMANTWERLYSKRPSEQTTTAPDGLPTITNDTVEFDLPF